MPFKQHHRGQHPGDASLFDARWISVLRQAAADLSWLYSRDYAEKPALKLVGDHYQLNVRQRHALQRAACSDAALLRRRAHAVPGASLGGLPVAIDGYNLLITVESALSGGILIRGRDGCIRDLASLHGSYHKVEETLPAIRLIGPALARQQPSHVVWYLDAPVSNSGRLRALLYEQAEAHGWDWHVALPPNADKPLAESGDVVVTSDSWILDRAARWANLAAYLIEAMHPRPHILDMTGLEPPCHGAAI